MSPWAILGIVLAVGAMTGGAYWQGRQDGAAGEIATQAREDRAAAIASDAAASAAAQAISKIKVQHRTITQEVQRDVIEKPVYRDPGCKHDADSLQRINSALTGSAIPQPASSGVVPGSDAPN